MGIVEEARGSRNEKEIDIDIEIINTYRISIRLLSL